MFKFRNFPRSVKLAPLADDNGFRVSRARPDRRQIRQRVDENAVVYVDVFTGNDRRARVLRVPGNR